MKRQSQTVVAWQFLIMIRRADYINYQLWVWLARTLCCWREIRLPCRALSRVIYRPDCQKTHLQDLWWIIFHKTSPSVRRSSVVLWVRMPSRQSPVGCIYLAFVIYSISIKDNHKNFTPSYEVWKRIIPPSFHQSTNFQPLQEDDVGSSFRSLSCMNEILKY